MQINALNVPPTPDGKPPSYTIVTEWFTLQDVPGPVLDLLGVVLMSIPVPRKYTDPVINIIVQQANDQNQAYAIAYARHQAEAKFAEGAPPAPLPPEPTNSGRRLS